jgi:hypothetical protein
MQDFFILKHDCEKFKEGALVKFIAIINEACLIEEVNTKERKWVMRYDIYPLDNHDAYGWWSYDETYQNKIPKEHLETIKKIRLE